MRYLLSFFSLLFVLPLSGQNISLKIKISYLSSNAFEEWGASVRHRWAINYYEPDNDQFRECQLFSQNDKDGVLYPNSNNVIEFNLDELPESIKIDFAGYDKEGNFNDCWPDGNQRQEGTTSKIFNLDFETNTWVNQGTVTWSGDESRSYSARLSMYIGFTLPSGNGIVVSDPQNAENQSNFCLGDQIDLNAYANKIEKSRIPDEYHYRWEYQKEGDNMPENNYKIEPRLPGDKDPIVIFDDDNNDDQMFEDDDVTYLPCGPALSYNYKTHKCVVTTSYKPIWRSSEIMNQLDNAQKDDPAIAITNFRNSSEENKVRFRYRLVNKDNPQQTSSPSNMTGNINVFDPPPQVSFINSKANNHYSHVSEQIEGDDAQDVIFEHVKCKGDDSGKIVIKNVTGGGSYFYYLKGPIPAGTNPDDIKSVVTYNGYNKLPPQKAATDTWVIFSNLAAGKYQLIVENIDAMQANGIDVTAAEVNIPANKEFTSRKCYELYDILIKEPVDLPTANYSISDHNGFAISCHGGSNGRINIKDATGGTGEYHYEFYNEINKISTDNSKLVMENLSAGTQYNFKVIDGLGCTYNHQVKHSSYITLNQPTPFVYQQVIKNKYPYNEQEYNIKCHGGTDEVIIKLNGGVLPYTFNNNENWKDTDGGGATIAGLKANNYSYPAKDANGCAADQPITFTLTQPSPVKLDSSTVKPLCYGSVDGELQVTASGGIPEAGNSYTFDLDYQGGDDFNPGTGIASTNVYDHDNLQAGTYQVIAKDKYQCAGKLEVTVNQPAQLSFNIKVIDSVTCYHSKDGQVEAKAIGGTPGYNYRWTSGNNNTLAEETNLAAGEGSSIRNLAPRTTYYLEVTDAHDCKTSEPVYEFEVPSPGAPLQFTVDPLTQVKDVRCFGGADGAVQLTATGGYQHRPYAFSNNTRNFTSGNQFAGLTANSHRFYVRDIQGCLDSIDLTIDQPSPVTAGVEELTAALCHGQSNGTVRLSAGGGIAPYQMSSDNGTSWVDGLYQDNFAAGAYPIMIRDANQCEFGLENIEIIEPEPLIATVLETAYANCGRSDGMGLIGIKGGTEPYTNQWLVYEQVIAENSLQVKDLAPGIYTVDIKDENQCPTSLQFAISNLEGPSADIVNTTPVSCHGGSDGTAEITIEATGTFTIAWPNGGDSVKGTGLTAGEQIVSITDSRSCVLYFPVNIESPEPMQVSLTESIIPTCQGDRDGALSIAVHGGNGGYSYLWHTGETTADLMAIAAGEYSLLVTDSKECLVTETIVLADADPVVSDIPAEQTLCVGQEATIDAGDNGVSFLWQRNNEVVSSAQVLVTDEPGTYQLTVTNAKGCMGYDTLIINFRDDLLTADFIMPSEGYEGDTVVLLDITYPAPDSISWFYNPGLQLYRRQGAYEELIFPLAGTYDIALETFKAKCYDQLVKQITILPGENPNANGRMVGLLIRQFVIHPNPASGEITVSITLDREADYQLRLMDLDGRLSRLLKSGTGKQSFELPVNLAVIPRGLYVLYLSAGGEFRTGKLLLQ